MKATPFFTIGIPVYNAEKYLPLCLDSILNQSFRDFELILVNDGSKDSSLNICKAYQEKDSRIIIIDQENGGVSAASNRVLENATGKYIYLMDNDDEMYEGILEKAHNYLVEKEVDILHGGYYSQSPNEAPKLRLFRNPPLENGFDSEADFMVYELKSGFAATMWTKFVRADFWQKTGILFDSQYDGCQDFDISRKLMQHAKTVHYVDDIILTWYHPREGSISTAWSYTMMRNYWRLTADILCEAKNELSGPWQEKYTKKIINSSRNSLWRLTNYTTEQQQEINAIIKPIRSCFKPKYAPDKRTAFLYFTVKHFGARNAAIIIRVMRKLKHIALGR